MKSSGDSQLCFPVYDRREGLSTVNITIHVWARG